MAVVLVVEDDSDLREELVCLLEDWAHTVRMAANGQEALTLLRNDSSIDVVLLDLMMPGLDGWTLRQKLLRTPGLDRIPVVVVSGVGDLNQEDRDLQAAAVLTKPFDLDQLAGVLSNLGLHAIPSSP